jgi:hypothetical protein
LIVFYVIEKAMRHFFLRAETGKAVGHGQQQVDEDYKQAAALAALVAPYRHARLSAVKLAGEPNNPVRMISDDLSVDELRAEVNKHIVRLDDAGVLGLEALLASKRRMANRRLFEPRPPAPRSAICCVKLTVLDQCQRCIKPSQPMRMIVRKCQ